MGWVGGNLAGREMGQVRDGRLQVPPNSGLFVPNKSPTFHSSASCLKTMLFRLFHSSTWLPVSAIALISNMEGKVLLVPFRGQH